MKVKVSEAVGVTLDWMVAKAEGTLGVKPHRCFDCKFHEERAGRDDPIYYCHHPKSEHETDFGWGDAISPDYGVHPACPISMLTPAPYSTDWARGGPLIEREFISIVNAIGDAVWSAYPIAEDPVAHSQAGPTPLIAAMRCYVSSQGWHNGEVEVPDELA